MSITRKLTLRMLKKNPKRTLVTIVGIILATALITAVANLAESFRASMILYEKKTGGDYHVGFYGVAPEDLKYFENNGNFKRIAEVREDGYAQFSDSKNPDKPYLYLLSMGEDGREMTALQLSNGRWPENEGEIVISAHMRSNGGSRLTVGDTITLTTGRRDIGEGDIARQNCPYQGAGEKFVASGEKEYTVVGIMQRPGYHIEPYTAPGYTAVTCVSDAGKEKSESCFTIYASFTSKGLMHREEVAEPLAAYASDHNFNETLLRWETGSFSGRTMQIIYGMGGIATAIIIVTSIFCIRNSFQISLTEKLRLYGMLSSVGTTSKQRRKMVYCEAFYLGIAGIPLGIGSGILATYVLVKFCSELVRYIVDMSLYYSFSPAAVVAGAVLASVTIFLSASQSARKASKISPIRAIRSNETIRRGKRELRVPRLLKWLFGIGGTLAYKNLRRSKVKYRTTVISIVVSVAVFITMTTFVRLGFQESRQRATAGKYPIVVTLQDEERDEQAALICSWEEVQQPIIRRQTYPAAAPAEQVRCTRESLAMGELGWDFGETTVNRNNDFHLWLCALGKEAYEKYCGEVGVSSAQASQGAIVYAEYRVGMDDGNGMKYYEGTIADFEKGSVLDLSVTGPAQDAEALNEDKAEESGVLEKKFSLSVVCQTKVQPYFLSGRDSNRIICIVSDAWLDQNLADYLLPQINLYIQCDDADAMENRIRNDVPLYSYYLSNYERAVKEQNNFWVLMAVFLYGFITVIALIGVTNIFNTVTTNMELRSREFAMLKSVGMTGREFRRMIQLESLFYGGGALCVGIPLGCVLSRLFHLALDVEMPYEWPLRGIGISVAAVFVLLVIIMRYSMGKIQKKNVIETIQNENI